ncbi:MAG: sigma-54-dependent Fis family transcriptional regulator [candidate division WOR-3 bacterium]|nr:MAG: sigma-54-dependent Fis family transcriptional regulator [candidate division WOR-3 bacterium]
MNRTNVLIVEDEKNQRTLLKRALERKDYAVQEAETGEEAITKFEQGGFDIVLLDQRLPDITGIEALTRIKKINPMIPVIIVTAFANVRDAVDAMKKGAFHYLTKPVDMDELLLSMKNALETLSLKRENEELRNNLREKFRYDKIIYASGIMEEVLSLAFRASKSDANVLITGESGTGKELIAGAIHHLSPRKKNNFVSAHLAALPETLVEAELFGHEKGAFTGADRRRIGKFEFASGGTIFLDEIGELPPAVQVKLLRVIQDKSITRLGSNDDIKVNVRLVCATNKKIEEEVESGSFRQDLFYRLNVIRIHVPTLRERKEDIPMLVDQFIRTHAQKEQKTINGITDEAMKILLMYHFPGNVRELQNIIERAIVLARGDLITKDELPLSIADTAKSQASGKLNEAISKIETAMIQDALRRTNGNQTKAAAELGISERVLRYKIGKHKIRPEK